MNNYKINKKKYYFKKNKNKFKIIKNCILISSITNIILSVLQIFIGIFSHSSNLIADSIHTLSDLIIDLIILITNKKSQKKPDQEHPYGHLRYENRTSLILGIFLLIIGIWMEYSAIQKILNPNFFHEIHIIALFTAFISVLIKEILSRYIIYIANKINSKMLITNAWHIRLDAISSFIVAIGITGNLLGFYILDPIALLIIGIFIIHIGFKFSNQSMQDLIDKGADKNTLQKIYDILNKIKELKGYHDLKTRKSGDFYLIDIHLELDGNLTITQGHKIATNVKKKLMENSFIINVMIHIDPYKKNFYIY
ncbi:cation diffusion facilitator family transporter [Candidatus Providencia siddallii]|uniref:Cation-efflux pump FieF n=1 Tax=Candidatus Providencia siddallii TaxID=1715285 RepID=A0ABM9NPP0_9GAMM